MWGYYLWGGVASQQLITPSGIPPPTTATGVPAIGTATLIAPTKSRIREYPPLRLSALVQAPNGATVRWAHDSYNPVYGLSDLTFSTTMPGGFEHADMKLVRHAEYIWPDLEELANITIMSNGGTIVWEGRIETIPSASGQDLAITPSAVGWQSHLDDNNSVRELFVDIDLTRWQAASIQRKINLLNAATDIEDPSARGGPNQQPALDCEMTGPWARNHVSEGWYDANGVPIGKMWYQWTLAAQGKIGDWSIGTSGLGNWNWTAGVGADDVFGGMTQSANQAANAVTGSGWIPTSGIASGKYWGMVQLYYPAAGGGNGVNYDVYWTQLWLYGNQNLPLYTTANNTQGVRGSDVLNYTIQKYAPKLKTSRAGIPTVQPTTFVIPQLVYLNPVTTSQVIKDVTQYELQDWAVWEGQGAGNPTFYWTPRGGTSKYWRGRIGPTRLTAAGPQIDRLWNGVIVSFTDVLGVSRTVGPPGSGCNFTDASLQDPDPQNPINQLGLRRWAPLAMTATTSSYPTPKAAIQVGQIFLAEQKISNTAGSASLTGYVEDEHGITWPAWMVRAGDYISFVDANDTSYRRIVSTSYSHDDKTNSITIDTPPDTMQAILSRLQVILAPITGG